MKNIDEHFSSHLLKPQEQCEGNILDINLKACLLNEIVTICKKVFTHLKTDYVDTVWKMRTQESAQHV